MKSKIMKFFSDLGRSLMMPVAALAACGIILGITSALLKTQVQDAVPFLTASVPIFIITTLNKVSGIVFTLLPVLFAISIAFGLAKEDKGVAAFAGFIGYYTFLVASSCMISTGIMDFSAMKISNILGVDTVDMGALAGIMAGLVTAKLHNKYHKVQFPAAIAFYGGKRFVALVVLVSMTVIGLVMPLIWAPISVGIDGLGRIIRSSGAFGVFIFGTLERLLIPTGLHHVLNSLFRTTAIGGTYHGVEGCLNIFLQFLDQAPLSDMKPYTQFLGQGKMPYMLFGLPAAALAIYRTTPQDKKAKVKALMIAGVAACFVSGITEPLEFSFMFIAPALFVFHAIMGGISFMLMSLLGVIVGNTGGGFIDFLLWGVFQPGSHWYWVIVVGIPYAFIYYFVFKWYLSRKKIVVSVSDDDDSDAKSDEKTNEGKKSGSNKTALQVIAGLGGMANIVVVNNCISRLRVDVKDMSLIDEETLKKTGSLGIVKTSDTHIQVVYGPKVEKIADAVRAALNDKDCAAEVEKVRDEKPKSTVIISSPMTGLAENLSKAPDEAFANKLMGDGAVVTPKDGTVVAPDDGTVLFVFDKKHAIGFATDSGVSMIIHVGIDTVKLDGKGFDVKVETGAHVNKGDVLMQLDLDFLRENAPSIASPVICTELKENQSIRLINEGEIKAGEPLFAIDTY